MQLMKDIWNLQLKGSGLFSNVAIFTRFMFRPFLLTEVEAVLRLRGDGRRGPGTQQLEVLNRTLVGMLPRAVAVGRLRGALPKVGRALVADDPPFALSICRCNGRWACGWRPRICSVGT